jgi:Tol biopolymer transport system component
MPGTDRDFGSRPKGPPLLLTVLAVTTVGCGASAKQNRQSAYAGRILIEMNDGLRYFITSPRPGRGCYRIARVPPYSKIAPNGRSVAYGAGRGKRILIRVLRLGDGRPRTIIRNTVGTDYPSWSTDSRSIVYAAGSSLVIARADGGGGRLFKPVTHKGASYATGKLSPDGRFIAFFAVWGNGLAGTLATELDVLDTANQRVRTLYVDPEPYGFRPEFAWAPAGETLAFTVSPPRTDLYSIHADGTGRRKLTHLDGAEEQINNLLWAPSGKSLALTITLPQQIPDVYLASADGSKFQRLTASRIPPPGYLRTGSRPLAWSPRGRRLLLQRGQHFVTLRPDGTDEQRVCSLPTAIHPYWYVDEAAWAP